MSLEHSVLGKNVEYQQDYNPALLFPVPRVAKRQEIGLADGVWPYYGEDLWTGYEISWLAPGGKPQVAIAEFIIPATSKFIIESKSFKLYLNSLNQHIFHGWFDLQHVLIRDLSKVILAPVQVELFSLADYVTRRPVTAFAGFALDDLALMISDYQADASLLSTHANQVKEQLYSDLLKSNCLITHQPDWGSVQISYQGRQIDHQSLLQYLIGFRLHTEFHEQCVERIFMDIWRQCQPEELTVYARYTRRGGLDINPFRSSIATSSAPRIRLVRQ